MLATQVDAHLRGPEHQMARCGRMDVIELMDEIDGLIRTKEQLAAAFKKPEQDIHPV